MSDRFTSSITNATRSNLYDPTDQSTYDEFKSFYTKNRKNFEFQGTNANNTLVLTNIYIEKHQHNYNHADIYFDAKGSGSGNNGWDELHYQGGRTNKVHVTYVDTTFNNTQYTVKLEGGFDTSNKIDGENNITGDVDVFINNAVDFVDLTQKGDRVDLRNATSKVTTIFNGDMGNEKMWGSDFADHFQGDDNDDYLEGNGGSDTLNGGSQDDTILGGDGDDVIITGSGDDMASGGAGNDIIFVDVNLTGNKDKLVFGDYILDSGKSGSKRDHYVRDGNAYNEADLFYVSFATAGVDVLFDGVLADGGADDFLTTAGIEAGGDLGSKLAMMGMKAAGYSVGGAVLSAGMTFGASYLSSSIAEASGPSLMISQNKFSTNSEVVIGDFDPWADTIVIDVDEYAGEISPIGTPTLDGGMSFEVDGHDFLTLYLPNDGNNAVGLSIQEDDPTGYAIATSGLSPEHGSIFSSVMANSLFVWKDNDGVHAQTMNGVDILGELEDTDYDAYLALKSTLAGHYNASGTDSGIWVIGDWGSSVLYGNGEYIAGTNSANVIFSGHYDYYLGHGGAKIQYFDKTFLSANTTTIYAGGGNDQIYGSTNGGKDILYGGDDDDLIHGMGGGVDQIFGGNGTDVASFITVRDDTTNYVKFSDGYGGLFYSGIEVDLRVHQADSYANNVLSRDDTSIVIAQLWDVEGIDGTELADKIIGDNGANLFAGNEGNDTLTGMGGSDTIDGGAGNDVISGGFARDHITGGIGDDTLTGNAGSDVFYFTAGDGNDLVTDFSLGDKLIFEGLTASELATLQASFAVNDKKLSVDASTEVTLNRLYDLNWLTLTSAANADGTGYDATIVF